MKTNVHTKWDLRFLELAATVAQWSKDLSTKVGAVAVSGHRSARMLINSGVAKVVIGEGRVRSMPPEQFEAARLMFHEAGVELVETITD